jgi:hypothetical protein
MALTLHSNSLGRIQPQQQQQQQQGFGKVVFHGPNGPIRLPGSTHGQPVLPPPTAFVSAPVSGIVRTAAGTVPRVFVPLGVGVEQPALHQNELQVARI